MLNSSLFNKQLICVVEEKLSREQVITELSNKLIKEGYVKKSYTRAVLEREMIFPTGLPTEPYAVAIPHTDIEHVIKPGIAFATLKKHVMFNVMGDPDNEIAVRLVFMLAMSERHMQIEILEDLMNALQDRDKNRQLVETIDIVEIEKILKHFTRYNKGKSD